MRWIYLVSSAVASRLRILTAIAAAQTASSSWYWHYWYDCLPTVMSRFLVRVLRKRQNDLLTLLFLIYFCLTVDSSSTLSLRSSLLISFHKKCKWTLTPSSTKQMSQRRQHSNFIGLTTTRFLSVTRS